MICKVVMRSESLDPEDTWKEIKISLTGNSKVRVVGTRDVRVRELI
jgi:hypothetical protein